MEILPDEAKFLLNHLFLPPKLPNESDKESGATKLLSLMAFTARDYGRQLDPSAQLAWMPIAESIAKWRDIYHQGEPCELRIEEQLKTMHHQATLLLFFEAQNAAVLVTKLESSYKLEAWEVSARQEDVLATNDSLIRQFPALALEISDRVVNDGNFVHHLATQIQTLATECYVPFSMEQVYKGETPIEEARESRHPRLVTEAYFTMLASYGQSYVADPIQKRVRDEVSFHKALLPWRRSSVWNCTKVALQLVIHNSPLASSDHKHYKQFLVYFLSCIANRLSSFGELSEYNQVLRTKIARRASKLEFDVPAFVYRMYLATVNRISTAMERQWSLSTSCEEQKLPFVAIEKYNTDLRLPKITPHLRRLLRHATDPSIRRDPIFQPPPSVPFSIDRNLLPDASIFNFSLNAQDSEEMKVAAVRRRKEVLILFQQWVAENLDSCLAEMACSAEVCEQLKTLIEVFWDSSRACFSAYAELMSGAILTVFELWVALDKMTIKLCDLIADYSPEIPKTVFAPLLLRKQGDMLRLQKVERYLQGREQNARYGSLFESIGATSLSVRLYERSRKAQKLMARLDQEALDEKQKVRGRFEYLRARYDEIMRNDIGREHDTYWPTVGPNIGLEVHLRRCGKCTDRRWALDASIERYEEILPESLPIRKAVVYELEPAREVTNYRDCLWFVVREVLAREATKITATLHDLRAFDPYKPHARSPGRIGLASLTKPHSKTHRHWIKITTSVDTIFHPHAMHWIPVDLVDETGITLGVLDRKIVGLSDQPHSAQNKAYSLAHLVRVQLGQSPYSKLIDTVHNIGVSQNSVIARQSTCPPDLHVSDWCNFGSMRYGLSLQLVNLLRALLSEELDLTSSATVVLVEQMLHEAGRPTGISSGALRAADVDIQEPAYIHPIAHFMTDTLASISDNWKNHLSAWILLTITQRLLTLNKDNDPPTRAWCLEFIRAIRGLGLRWIKRLKDLHDTQHKTLIPQLFAQPIDCAEYIACSIYIHDYSKFFDKTNDKWLKLCVERDLVLQVQLESIINNAIDANPSILTAGLQIVWPLINPRGSLVRCPTMGNRWYEGRCHDSTTSIHLNIASGSLLVGSKPLSILPERYTRTEIYQQVLEDKLVDVVASDDPRMEYMTVKEIDGHQVYFGFAEHSGELHLRTKKDGLRYAAILRGKFEDDLPEKMLENSRPWLCIDKLVVEFRNELLPWCSGKSDWVVSPVKMNDCMYKMESQKSFLLDNRLGVGFVICSVLAPLEMSKYIHIVFDKKRKKLLVELPRYHLNFEVDQHGQLQCNELAAFVRSSQKLGTFHGLKNRLVLQDIGSRSTNPKLWVLIPFGAVTVDRNGPHVKVTIDTDEWNEVTFFKFRIDQTLRCLVPDQVEGHLWKAYLHVCTSSALPDELTGCTGLEESFRTLDDRWLRTCVPFSLEAKQTLTLISEISPSRSFYPSPDSRCMQKTDWDKGFSFMLQHDGLHKKVVEINNHNMKAHFLNEGVEYLGLKSRGNDKNFVLAERALHTWRKYWHAGFVPGQDMECGDKVYNSRDKGIDRNSNPVFQIASTVSSWKVSQWTRCDFFEMLKKRQRKAGQKGSSVSLSFSTPFKPTSLTQLLTLDINESWADLFQYCLEVKEADKAELLFAMSMIVFGNAELLDEVMGLLPFAILHELHAIGLPDKKSYSTLFGSDIDWTQYDLFQGDNLDWSVVSKLLDECELERSDKDEDELPQHDGPVTVPGQQRAKMHAQRSAIGKAVKAAWADGHLTLPEESSLDLFDVDLLQNMLSGRLAAWKKNSILRDHCKRWEEQLAKITETEVMSKPDIWLSGPTPIRSPRRSDYPALFQAMSNPPRGEMKEACAMAKTTAIDGCLKDMFSKVDHSSIDRSQQQEQLHQELQDLVSTEVGVQDVIKQDYIGNLLQSISALRAIDQPANDHLIFPDQSFLTNKLEEIRTSMQALLHAFNSQFRPWSPGDEALRLAGLWPKATTPNLLQLISKTHREKAPDEWLDTLLVFARALCSVQRIERIIRFHEINDLFNFRKEVENQGHDSDIWELKKKMDWLLFEIQNDFLIRPVQAKVANKLLEPENGVIQLQMGDGKSSVILPLFCMSVAVTRKHLVRVVILKSLAKETLAKLSKALSGFVQTPLYWLPFSRSTPLSEETPSSLRDLWKECRDSQGVLLTLPEHLNSFRLIGNDRLTAGKLDLAQKLLGAQKSLDSMARDIIDESDEVLKPAYELVYTNGEPRPLSGAPYRWDVLLAILDVVQTCARDIHKEFPHGLEYKNNGAGIFATVRVLTPEAGAALLNATVHSVIEGALPTLSFTNHDSDTIQAFSYFVTTIRVKGQVHEAIKKHFRGAQEKLAVYLLRGLFAFGLLAATFEKRFFVNYGLDRTRCLSAVPYRAKGCAATAAEFAQPDMMILLTALSYYYTGLEMSDTRQALNIVMRHPDPSDEYSRWISGSNVPDTMRSITSINMQDDECVTAIHQQLHKNKTVIDFFLRNVVFQRECKEYLNKLSSSAWDLCARDNGKVTGGFSGTMDSYLPDSMSRTEIEGLMHFDAAVLASLLQSRNRRYVKASDQHGLPLDTMALLQLIDQRAPDTSVIIDVGAQTLDRNQDVAEAWLRIHHQNRSQSTKSAAIFFNEQDEKEVVTVDGNVQPWASSPYKEQVGSCLVYLDQHHCRGTDQPLPDGCAAALLLGPRLPKDSFVQAAMRLRKLAENQSIITFAPPEVDNSIRKLLDKPKDEIDISDVVLWVMEQSCDALRAQQTLKIKRNLEHVKRSKAFRDRVNKEGRITDRSLYKEDVLQKEVHEVEELYKADVNSLMRLPKFSKREKKDQDVVDGLKAMQHVDKQAYVALSLDKEQEQEQEREQQHEREAEREIQRPMEANAKEPDINKWLNEIITRDEAPHDLPAGWMSAFCLMGQTTLYSDPLWSKFPALLVATRDHLDTVKSSTGRDQDDFLRPVDWILKLKYIKELILIGPHEAKAWEPYLRRSHYTTLIMYAPKTRRDMRSLDNLDVYTIPERVQPLQVDPNILTLLRLFAGQLYFNSFEEYERFCTLLSIRCAPEPEVEGVIRGTRRSKMLKLSEKSAKKFDFIPLVTKWTDMRRKGVEWSHTDVGRVLNGEILSVKYFE